MLLSLWKNGLTSKEVTGFSRQFSEQGAEKPNKKYYDPRMSLRAGEEKMAERLVQAMKDLNCIDRL